MSLRVMVVPDDDGKSTTSFEKEEDSSEKKPDEESEATFGEEIHESTPIDEGAAFLILLKKEPEKPKEDKETEDLTGGSFREMFKKGREKVISKANGGCDNGDI